MKTLLFVIGGLMILFTVVPLVRKDDWWIRILDFPRLQINFVLAALIIVYFVLGFDSSPTDYLFITVLGACLVYQAWMMFPYTKLAQVQVQSARIEGGENTISLVFANVLMENRNAEGFRRAIDEKDPDIILAAEGDEWWLRQLEPYRRTHPYTVLQPQDNTYGLLLYSRLRMDDAEVKFLVQKDVPSIHATVTLRSGVEVALRCLHPRPPVPQEDDRSTERDAELLIVGKEAKSLNAPVIVFGDLNDVAWSHTNYLFQNISGLLDPRIGRGFYHTFHAKYPLVRFPLDHCFHSNHFRLVDFQRLVYFGSDHFPVYIKLNYEPDAAQEQEELKPDIAQRIEAEEKIRAASPA